MDRHSINIQKVCRRQCGICVCKIPNHPGYYRKKEATLFSCNEFYRSIISTSPNLLKQPIHSPETHHFPNTEILKFPSSTLQFFLKGFGRALENIAAIQEQKNDNLKFHLRGPNPRRTTRNSTALKPTKRKKKKKKKTLERQRKEIRQICAEHHLIF